MPRPRSPRGAQGLATIRTPETKNAEKRRRAPVYPHAVMWGTLLPSDISVGRKNIRYFVSSENFDFNALSGKTKIRAKAQSVWHGKIFVAKKAYMRKTLAKSEKVCYNILRVPVIRLYRSALSLLCRVVVLVVRRLAFFVCILIIPQKYRFVNSFLELYTVGEYYPPANITILIYTTALIYLKTTSYLL